MENISSQEKIQTDLYRYHIDLKSLSLGNSITEQGILLPLWVIEEDGFKMIDGHRRVWELRRTSHDRLPVIIFPPNKTEEKFISALHINLAQSKLSAAEKLRVYEITRRNFSIPTSARAAELISFSNIPDIYKISKKFVNLPEWIREYFHRINLSLKQIQRLQSYPVGQFELWFKLGAALHFKGTELRLLLEYIREICFRDNISAAILWNEMSLNRIMNSNQTTSQKIQSIKKKVAEKRLPVLTGINLNLIKHARSIEKEFSSKLKIKWDPTLEQPNINFNFLMNKGSDIKNILELLSKNSIQDKISGLFENINKIPGEDE